jgi:hypothetical protein
MASGIYNAFKTDILDGSVNLANGGDSFKVALLDDNHAFTATNSVWSDISANEISGTGYTAGGEDLSGQGLSGTTSVTWDATDTEWTSASFTAYHAVIYDASNSNSLVCSIDFGGAQTVSSGTFTISWNTDGILVLS